jgi:hypothetical protein
MIRFQPRERTSCPGNPKKATYTILNISRVVEVEKRKDLPEGFTFALPKKSKPFRSSS